jgi:carbamoyltransferase
MRILGLHGTGHDSGAALITDGTLFAIGEERLSRVKNDGSFPRQAIAHVLDGEPVSSIDLVVLDVCDGGTREALATLRSEGYSGEVLRIDHHFAHAMGAHFVAPEDGAAVLVVDAGGTRIEEWPADLPRPSAFPDLPGIEQQVQSFYVARGRHLESLHGTFTRAGLRLGIGWLHGLVTMHLGFGPMDSGKTMGLAALAPEAPADDVWPWVSPGGDLLFRSDVDVSRPETWGRWLSELAGVPPRRKDQPLDERHAAVAAKLQRTTEAFMLQLARQLHAATDARTLCLAGGVGLNVLANRRLQDESPFRRVVVQPAATDTGVALGCALAGAIAKGIPLPSCPEVSFLGRAPSAAAYAAAAARARELGFAVSRPDDLLDEVVARLGAAHVVGWVEGASELGPRALGHRSLLADARDPASKDRVNSRVKHREPFRPFAPVVLEERCGELFDLEGPSANMLFSAWVHAAARSVVPAVTHADGTVRVQTVSRSFPGRLRALLERFDAKTGVPALLNTSLNGPGEPIVESPDDALALLESSQMDALVLDDWLIARTEAPAAGPRAPARGLR